MVVGTIFRPIFENQFKMLVRPAKTKK